MSIENLRILTETTFDDFPDKLLQSFIIKAISQFDELKTNFSKMIPCNVICEGVLLAKPNYYNKMVETFNEGTTVNKLRQQLASAKNKEVFNDNII